MTPDGGCENAPGGVVRLGVMPPLTGLVGIYGPEIARAAQIACDEVNESGGVHGMPLELVIVDDGSLPESSVIAARKLVSDHRCAAIVGNLLSNSRIAVAYSVAEPSRIPYLNFSFYEGSISSRYFFHFAALPNQQIDRMIPFMAEKFGGCMYFAGHNYEWPRGSIDAAKRALLRSRGDVAGERYLAIGMSDSEIEDLLDRVEAVSPDVFVPYFAGDDQVRLLSRFSRRGMKQRMAVVMGHYDEIMASQLPADVRGGFYSSNTYFMTVPTPENRQVLGRLAALPGVSGLWPSGNGILTNFGEGAYLCVKAFAQAANAAGTLAGEALVDALRHCELSGPQGMVTMDPESQHARVNTFLACSTAGGVFEIVESFGALSPEIPERYHHQRIANRATLEDDIRLQSRMLELMSEAVLLVSASDGRIIYVNAGAERMFGYARGEMLGLPISCLNDVRGQDPVALSASIIQTLNDTGAWQGQVSNVRKDGAQLWCSASVTAFSHPVHGEVWLGVHTDISRLKAAEQGLLASEERLRLVIDGVNDGIWDWCPGDGQLYLSPRWKAILGFREDELENVESSFFKRIHPDDYGRLLNELNHHLERQAPYVSEIRLRCKDGSYRWVLTRGEAVRDPSGRVLRMVGAITDIDDRKVAEDELRLHRENLEELVSVRTAELEKAKSEAERASLAKSEFLSRMSHELRTPMNAILGFSQVLAGEVGNPEHLDYVGEIGRAGEHLLELIDELLDLSRIEAGRLAVVIGPVSLSTVLAEAMKMVGQLVRDHQVRVDNNCSTHVMLLADATRLRQILVNLLSNAAKYNRPGGSIRVDCVPISGQRLRISVVDDGIGIPPEKLRYLFTPFERLGAERGSVEGAGIGLALSKKLAELMGGVLSVESTPDRGSTFSLDVPVFTDMAGGSEACAEVSDAVQPGVWTILYVEDNSANLKVVEAMLRRNQRLRLLSAATGTYGLELAKRYLPDAILLDIHLPGLDGYAVLAALKADAATRDIPVIALSADAMPIDVENALRAGFSRYLTKPIKAQELSSALFASLRDSM